jgi:hypothetical protein
VRECRWHSYRLFSLGSRLDCNRFNGKILRGLGHARPPRSTLSREACRADPITSVDTHSIDLKPSLVKEESALMKQSPASGGMEQPKKRLDQVRDVLRLKHCFS